MSMKLFALVASLSIAHSSASHAAEPGPFSKLKPGLWNSFLLYNKENGAWEETTITLTYFENLFQPFLQFDPNDKLRFRVGAGLLVPMNQEEKIRRAYPYVQSRLFLTSDSIMDLGSLDTVHDLPGPLLDPLIAILPQIRLGDSTQIPITYESFPITGAHSHGLYEYGISYRWGSRWDPKSDGSGEVYLNWQLPDTGNHRERFDIGLSVRRETVGLPLYFAAHYWHNGGHENPHLVEITENYTAAFGLRTNHYNALIVGSLFFPDRAKEALTQSGAALYFDYKFSLGNWYLQPVLFISDELRNKANKYISIEGDPFFRVPFYGGLNVGASWELFSQCKFDLNFINGFFQRSANEAFNPTKTRYDQMVRLQLHYLFGEEK